MKARLMVLVVEDNRADALLTKMALQEQAYECAAIWAETIDAAVEYLEAGLETNSTLDVVLLDGQVGKDDAAELLIYMKLHDDLKHIPIVIMTGTQDKRKHEGWLAQGADWIMEKQMAIEDLESGIGELARYARPMA